MGGTASPSPAHGSDARRYILEKQLPNGWLGPDDGFGGVGNTYWTGWNTAASLLQYADARRAASDEDTARRCEKATLRYIQEVTRRMKIHPCPRGARTGGRIGLTSCIGPPPPPPVAPTAHRALDSAATSACVHAIVPWSHPGARS